MRRRWRDEASCSAFLNLHFAIVALLLILNLTLGVRLFSRLEHACARPAPTNCNSNRQIAYRALQLGDEPVAWLAAEGERFP